MSMDRAIVVMGVSGCGKSTVGRQLADRLGFVFQDADDFHPAVNVQKMRDGIALTDADREPWLMELATLLEAEVAARGGVVLACSALKDSYRRMLSSGRVIPRFVYLEGTKELIADRMARRAGHFMPVGLLDSQFETLEVPGAAICVDIAKPVPAIVAEIEEKLLAPDS
ncbi:MULTISPECIES: gluconokinase [Kordiimonas]|uniref:gluconokinase n=1 Tax=Kordiimonas TaxID=288021 RepID=UPI00257ECB0B|nr:gluconokinase [Kordiimonas sp. UBA4487]